MRKNKKKLNIRMMTVPVELHRYPSIDDYFDPVEGEKYIEFTTTIGDMGNTDYEFLVFMHAITEQYLCWKHGVKDKDITEFDIKKDKEDPDAEPGNDPKAPYHKEHMVGNDIEALLSVALGVDFPKYEAAIDKTLSKYPKKK